MSFLKKIFSKEEPKIDESSSEANQDGFVSPDAYAQSAFELSEESSIENLMKHYEWEWGQCRVTCEYASYNETSRVYYILTINGQEFVRSNYGENIATVLSMMNEDNDYEILLSYHNHAVHIFHWEVMANACPSSAEELESEFRGNAQKLRELWEQL